MSSDNNPFQGDIIRLDLPLKDQESCQLERAETSQILEQILSPSSQGGRGSIFLLRSPRAGFGKTFLLRKLTEELGSKASIVHLPIEAGKPVSWIALYQSLLSNLMSIKTAGAPSQLDAIVRHLLARSTADLIRAGKIPSSDRKAAIKELIDRPLATFNFGRDDKAAVCLWFKDYYEDLRPLVVDSLTAATGLEKPDLTGWLDVLYRFTEAEGNGRNGLREEAFRRLYEVIPPTGGGNDTTKSISETSDKPAVAELVEATGTDESRTEAQGADSPSNAPAITSEDAELLGKGRFLAFSRLASVATPVVLILDGLDSIYRDSEAGLRIATILGEIQTSCPNVSGILSTNNDLWQATFGGQLPSAIEDRLTETIFDLPGIGIKDAEVLVGSRLDRAGIAGRDRSDFLGFLSLERHVGLGGTIAPRALLRLASKKWELFRNGDLDLESEETQKALGTQDTHSHAPAAMPEDIPLQPDGSQINIFDDGFRSFLSGAMEDLAAKGRDKKDPELDTDTDRGPLMPPEEPDTSEEEKAQLETSPSKQTDPPQPESEAVAEPAKSAPVKSPIPSFGAKPQQPSASPAVEANEPSEAAPVSAPTFGSFGEVSPQARIEEVSAPVEPAPPIQTALPEPAFLKAQQEEVVLKSPTPVEQPESPIGEQAEPEPANEATKQEDLVTDSPAPVADLDDSPPFDEKKEQGLAEEEAEPSPNAASFTKIKSMLARLREDRKNPNITAALQSPAPSLPSQVPQQEPSPRIDSPFQPMDPLAPSTVESAEMPIFVETQDADEELVDRYRDILDEVVPTEGTEVQQDRLGRVVKVAGYRFPVVRYSDFRLPEAQEKPVAKWSFENNEILFGFEPLDDFSYWKALSAFASKRALLRNDLLSSSAGDHNTSSVKLVVFASEGERENIERWLSDDDRAYADIIILPREDLGAIYATDELIGKAEEQSINYHPGDIIGNLAGELDSVWRRITRPVKL